jgi:25S rRNA (cytosine2870-C5)-methyltransferase
MDVKKAAHMQRELLRAAVDCCKIGGTIVYSTCSIAAEENEGVVDYILKRRWIKIVETGLPVDKEGITSYEGKNYDPRVKFSRRVYPHMHNMDGFFIAKLIKTKDGPRQLEGEDAEKEESLKKSKVKRQTLASIPKKKLGKRDRAAIRAGKKLVVRGPRVRSDVEPEKLDEKQHHDVPVLKSAKKPIAPVKVLEQNVIKPAKTEPTEPLSKRKAELLAKLAEKRKKLV